MGRYEQPSDVGRNQNNGLGQITWLRGGLQRGSFRIFPTQRAMVCNHYKVTRCVRDGLAPRNSSRQTISNIENNGKKNLSKEPEEKRAAFPLVELTDSCILGCLLLTNRSERVDCRAIFQKREPNKSRTTKTQKIADVEPPKKIKAKNGQHFPLQSNTAQYQKFPKTTHRRREPDTHAREDARPNGRTARRSGAYLLGFVAKEKQKPPNEPQLWRKGRGPFGGWQPIAGTYHCHSNRGHLGLEGSQ